MSQTCPCHIGKLIHRPTCQAKMCFALQESLASTSFGIPNLRRKALCRVQLVWSKHYQIGSQPGDSKLEDSRQLDREQFPLFRLGMLVGAYGPCNISSTTSPIPGEPAARELKSPKWLWWNICRLQMASNSIFGAKKQKDTALSCLQSTKKAQGLGFAKMLSQRPTDLVFKTHRRSEAYHKHQLRSAVKQLDRLSRLSRRGWCSSLKWSSAAHRNVMSLQWWHMFVEKNAKDVHGLHKCM